MTTPTDPSMAAATSLVARMNREGCMHYAIKSVDGEQLSTCMQIECDQCIAARIATALDAAKADSRALALLLACRDVCMYCGKRAPGAGPATGPNEAGNYVHLQQGYPPRLCAATSIHSRIRFEAPPLNAGTGTEAR